MTPIPGFAERAIEVEGASVHVVCAGSGPPV